MAQTNTKQFHSNEEKGTRPILKRVMSYLILFLLLTGVQLGLLVLAAVIPREAIQSHMQESADYLTEKPVFFQMNQSDHASIIDRYADSILLGILYGYDDRHPLSSVMRSSYYTTATENENDNLKAAVYENQKPNYDYSRYWHGSIAYMKPLLVFFNLQQIYILNAVILCGLMIWMLLVLRKQFSNGVSLCFLIAAVSISIWYVPLSLEYTWNFFLMLLTTLFVTQSYKNTNKGKVILPAFFTAGSLTAYFDFLSTETLTLLVPLVFLLILESGRSDLKKEKSDVKSHVMTCVKTGVLWGIGYISCFLAKWTLASIILGENAFKTAFSNATLRMYGESEDVQGIAQIISALLRNLSCIFPFNLMGSKGYIICIGTLIVLWIFYYLTKNEKSSKSLPGLFILPAIIPYIRYIVLANHSYMHYFFTFRAQMVTVLCIALTFYFGVDRALLQKEWRKLWKKKPKKKTR